MHEQFSRLKLMNKELTENNINLNNNNHFWKKKQIMILKIYEKNERIREVHTIILLSDTKSLLGEKILHLK
jgi:hypothetical protein